MNMKEIRIDFNRDWTKREMQELIEQHCYLSFGEHEDLKALCINEEDFVPERRDWLETGTKFRFLIFLFLHIVLKL